MKKLQNAAQSVVDALKKEEIDLVFGLLGSHVLPIFSELYESKEIRLVTSKHENNASFMADMYGRLTGKPGVVLVTAGPGATNSVTGIAQAYRSLSPVVHISGTVPQNSGPREFHGTKHPEFLQRIFEEVCKTSLRVHDVKELSAALAFAFKKAVVGARGPVHIEIPQDVVLKAAEKSSVYTTLKKSKSRAGTYKRLVRQLQTAKKPILLLGSGIASEKCTKKVLQCAEISGAAVILLDEALGIVPEDHSNYAGSLGGFRGDSFSKRIIQDADLCVCLGMEVETGIKKQLESLGIRGKTFYYSFDGREEEYLPLTTLLEKTMDALGASKKQMNQQQLELIQQRREAYKKWREELIDENQSNKPIHFGFALGLLSKRLKNDAYVIGGVGNHNHWNQAMIPATSVESRFQAGGWGSMGWELCAAMTAKLVHPHRQVVAITGDGSLLMSLSDLGTLVEEKAPVLIVVMNDSKYGMTHYFSNWVGTEIQSFNFAEIAKSVGACGIRVENPDQLEGAFDEAFKALESTPVILDIVCGSNYTLPNFDKMGRDLLLSAPVSLNRILTKLKKSPSWLKKTVLE